MGEGALVVADRALASALERSFERDLTVSKEISRWHGGRTHPWRRLARRLTVMAGADR